MFKKKNEPRIKTKVMEVKSKALIGKSQMEKVTEKLTSEGWELVSRRKVANKDRYTLEFQYQMSPEEIARNNRNKLIRNGVIGFLVFACCGITYAQGAAINRENDASTSTAVVIQSTDDAHATQTATLWTPTHTFTPSMTPSITPSPTITDTPSITPSPTITDTPAPTSTARPTNTPRPTSLPSGTTYYSQGNGVNVRDCPQLDCDIVVALGFGQSIEIIDTNVDGADVDGDTRWMEGVFNGNLVYVHSSLVSRSQPSTPVPAQQSNTSSTTNNTSTNNTGGSGTTNTQRPANCAEAVAMGLTAEQAAQWSHLDRDGDGVACYGD